MQRRLFLLFLVLMFLPAAAVLMVNWQMSERHLGLLDSPGLQRAQESSLELARRTLEVEKTGVVATAEALAASLDETDLRTLPTPPAGTAYLLAPAAGDSEVADEVAAGEFDPLVWWPSLNPASLDRPVRLRREGTSYILAAAALEDGGRLLVVSTMDPDLAATLDAVAAGSTGLRQMRLFYGRLLRTDTVLVLAVLALVLLAVSLWLSRRLARQIAAPMQDLVAGTEKVAGGDLDHRVEVQAPAELGELVAAFNRMTGQLQRGRKELVRAERIAAWQGVARRLAHEIKNPLTPITLAMHRIGRKSDDPTVAECVGTVLEETDNLKRLADEFSLYARLPQPQKQTTDLHGLLQQVAELYLSRGEIEVRWHGWGEPPFIQGDPGQLRQVFANLLKNSAEAMAGRGAIDLEFARGAGMVTVRLRDTGPGLPGDPGDAFEPYFTTKPSGTGLGLAIARKIVEDHGGTLVSEAAAAGAVFCLELPAGAVADGTTGAAASRDEPTRKEEA